MIKVLEGFRSLFAGRARIPLWSVEDKIENNLKVGPEIEVLSTFYGGCHGNQRAPYIDAEASHDVRPGDMLVLILSSCNGQLAVPSGFKHAHTTEIKKRRRSLTVTVATKIFEPGDSPIRRIYRDADCFVTMLTLRGPDLVVQAKGFSDTAGGFRGLAFTPRVRTAEGGCLISVFLYGDPLEVDIQGQHQLLKLSNGCEGLAIGVSKTEGGTSRRIKALSNHTVKGNGEDIAVAIAVY